MKKIGDQTERKNNNNVALKQAEKECQLSVQYILLKCHYLHSSTWTLDFTIVNVSNITVQLRITKVY